MSSEDRCYICLCGDGEQAPYCNRRESKDFIRPCKCSLIVHRRCFLSWVSTLAIPEVVRPQGATQFGIPSPFSTSSNSRATAFHYSVFQILSGRFSQPMDKMCVFVDCPQCRRRICLATRNSTLLNMRRLYEGIVDNLGGAVVIPLGLSLASTALITTAVFVLSESGKAILRVLAKPSVLNAILRLNRNGTDNRTSIAMAAFIPVWALYMNSALPADAQTDLFVTMVSYSVFSTTEGGLEPAPCRLMRRLALVKLFSHLLYNVTINRIYYHWHKRVQPCFFSNKMTASELEREVASDEAAENREEAASMRDAQYPKWQRVLRRTGRNFSAWGRTFLREMFLCSRVDFSQIFCPSSIWRNLFSTAIMPYLGRWLSGKYLCKIPGFNGLLNRFTDTPDESEFLGNLVGCGLFMLGSGVISFGMNYLRYKQLVSFDVENNPDKYLAEMGRQYGQQQH